MAPVVPDPAAIRAFPDGAAFERWLAEHHARAGEIWIKIHKKASGLKSITPAEALDVALCWGWIDGIRKAFDDSSFLQRYSPRSRRSIWSEINKGHVARLIAAGRMTEHGLRQVEAAKADGRWERSYASPRNMEIPADLLAAIEAVPAAYETFQRLSAQNRFSLAFRTHNMKTDAGRRRRIANFVEMLKRGETPYPNGKSP